MVMRIKQQKGERYEKIKQTICNREENGRIYVGDV